MKQYRQGFHEEAVKLSNEVSEERRAGIFHAGHGRDARRGERALAELGLFAFSSMKRTPSSLMTLPIVRSHGS